MKTTGYCTRCGGENGNHWNGCPNLTTGVVM